MHQLDGHMHVCLLSTRNHAFAKIMSQIIKLKANFPKHGSNRSVWIMLPNSHLIPLMTIV
jgi:hypothetical protein